MKYDDSVGALLEQGHDKLDRGQYQAALEIFQQAAAREPANAPARYGMGLACYWLGRYGDAVEHLTEALRIKEEYPLALAWRGLVYRELKQKEQATADFERAIAIPAGDFEDWRGIGIALNGLQRYEDALASYKKAIEIKPDDHYSWHNRGIALYNLGRYEKAVESYKEAIKYKANLHDAWYDRGNALYKLERHEEALESYNKAIEFKDDSPYAWYSKGNALDSLQRYEKAFESYNKAIEFKPNFSEALNNRGNTLNDLGRYSDALDSYEKAIAIKPDFPEPRNGKGIALDRLGRYEKAIASYDKALGLTGNQFWQAWLNRGIALLNSEPFNSRGYEAAIQTWTAGINALQPEYAEYHLGKGELHRKKGSQQYKYGKQLLNPINRIPGPALGGPAFRAPIIGGGKDTRRTLEQNNPFPHWQLARESYEAALTFLTFEKFPERHLEILQDLIKVCSDLGDAKAVENLLEKGAQLLDELRRTCEFETQKISLSRKFAAFDQLRVDIRAESGDRNKQIEALELAEKRKNTCLAWMRYGWNCQFPSPNYQQMRQLLNPQTAIIYWHVSSAALTTFILRYDKKYPITRTLKPVTEKKSFGVLSQPVAHEPEAHLPAIRQLEAFENWVADWKRDYQEYRQISPKSSQKETHPWRVKMEERLNELAGILEIERLLTHLTGITQLILIPHRDLHLLPLEYLFREKGFTLTRLPSAQVGIQLANFGNAGEFPLLNVEQVGNPPLQFSYIESSVISLFYRNHKRLGDNATPAQVIEALRNGAGAFHFTGHGDHNLDSPLESALIFNCGESLTLRDIFALENLPNCKLVSLSACETGITSPQTIVDEYVGLVSGFLAVGATHVASTLWQVDSQATALMLIQFYRNLRKNKSAAHLPDEEPHPPTPSPRAGRGSKREFSMTEKSVTHSSPAPRQNNAVPAIALQQAQEWLRTATYDILGEWYKELASEFQERDWRGIQLFLETQATHQKKAAIIEPNKRPYEHPYYWAAFTGTGIL